MPGEVKPDTDDVGEEPFAIVTIAGFDASAVHVPLPVALKTVLEY